MLLTILLAWLAASQTVWPEFGVGINDTKYLQLPAGLSTVLTVKRVGIAELAARVVAINLITFKGFMFEDATNYPPTLQAG